MSEQETTADKEQIVAALRLLLAGCPEAFIKGALREAFPSFTILTPTDVQALEHDNFMVKHYADEAHHKIEELRRNIEMFRYRIGARG